VAAHIYAATANAANRTENHLCLGRRDPLLRRIGHGLYVRAASGAVRHGLTSEPAVDSPDRIRCGGLGDGNCTNVAACRIRWAAASSPGSLAGRKRRTPRGSGTGQLARR
jgi:hypothetical protein